VADLVLDAGAVSYLAKPSRFCAAVILELRQDGRWPPAVPSIVLVESLHGHPGRDANTNRFLRTCDVIEEIPEALARRAAFLRSRARRGSAVDALVVALAEPGGMVLTSDPGDLLALAARADEVRIERV
jgi:hypothetical protein